MNPFRALDRAWRVCFAPGRRSSLPLFFPLLLASLLCLLPTAQAQSPAQTYPARAVTFIVPFTAGSATDLLARALGQAIAEQTHEPVVVDNKAGASGMLAAQLAARAPADGYTVLITTNTTQAADEHLYKKLAYDPVKDFAPVTGLGVGGQVLVVNPASPFKTVAELVAYAKSHPNKLSFGSGSSSSRVAGEMFKQLSGTEIVHVPYKSNPNAVNDLLGGHIDLMITDTATGLPQIKSGKLRALGYSLARRSPVLPDLPTIAEAGVKGYDLGYWFAAYVPAGTPAAIVGRLNELFAAANKAAGVKSFFDSTANDAWHTTPDELARFQSAEAQKWGRVIKAAGIEPE